MPSLTRFTWTLPRYPDLDEHTEYRPVKSNGYALPGFFAGNSIDLGVMDLQWHDTFIIIAAFLVAAGLLVGAGHDAHAVDQKVGHVV